MYRVCVCACVEQRRGWVRSEAEGDWNIYWYVLALLLPLTHSLTCCCCCTVCATHVCD
jgi:hypothetical protein